MAYEMLKKRLSRCDVIEHQPLTLAYLLRRVDIEEGGQHVPYDPRITDELLLPLMAKPRKTPAGGRERANSGQKKVRQ